MKVYKVYSGKVGCMCGCNGKYSYTAEGAVNHSPGYDVSDSVNERTVKMFVKQLLADPLAKHEDGHVYAEHNGRIKVAFFG
jgi:hypothetical protein